MGQSRRGGRLTRWAGTDLKRLYTTGKARKHQCVFQGESGLSRQSLTWSPGGYNLCHGGQTEPVCCSKPRFSRFGYSMKGMTTHPRLLPGQDHNPKPLPRSRAQQTPLKTHQNPSTLAAPIGGTAPARSLNPQRFQAPCCQRRAPQLQRPGWVHVPDPTAPRVPNLPPGPGLCGQFAPSSLSPSCPALLLTHFTLSVLHVFISRQINQSFPDGYTLRCSVPCSRAAQRGLYLHHSVYRLGACLLHSKLCSEQGAFRFLLRLSVAIIAQRSKSRKYRGG